MRHSIRHRTEHRGRASSINHHLGDLKSLEGLRRWPVWLSAVRERESESIRVRLTADIKEPWEQVLLSHNITQQAAVASLVRWALTQDPLTRSMIFGQVPDYDHAALTKIVLKRLAGDKAK